MKTRTIWLGILLSLGGFHPALAITEQKSLAQVVEERPFPEYSEWWAVGDTFSSFMSDAIVSEWSAVPGNDGALAPVRAYAAEYVETVYGREARASLVEDFVDRRFEKPLRSGEFDALSYAFFRSAFEIMAAHTDGYDSPLEAERRSFTRRVGKKFFARVEHRLNLVVPPRMDDDASFGGLKECIDAVGAFLLEQGYYRDHVAFRFDVEVEHQGRRIAQAETDFLKQVERDGRAYALFEMGYPVILPSAVYLFHSIGEAQHHSSRTIEEIFERVGYDAGETEDFDPIGFPSEMVVELWEIRKKP